MVAQASSVAARTTLSRRDLGHCRPCVHPDQTLVTGRSFLPCTPWRVVMACLRGGRLAAGQRASRYSSCWSCPRHNRSHCATGVAACGMGCQASHGRFRRSSLNLWRRLATETVANRRQSQSQRTEAGEAKPESRSRRSEAGEPKPESRSQTSEARRPKRQRSGTEALEHLGGSPVRERSRERPITLTMPELPKGRIMFRIVAMAAVCSTASTVLAFDPASGSFVEICMQ